MKKHLPVILTGAVTGVIALALVAFGNPANMGFCIACFIRDTAGALKLQSASAVQYVRPEIIGLIIGSFLLSLLKKEFQPRGGSSPMTRFVLGMVVMTGALVFLGCPLRMLLRLGGGDLNALVGLVGFAGGVGIGVLALNRGFSLKRAYTQSTLEGAAMPALVTGLLVMVLLFPVLFAFSESGPGSLHAAVWISLAGGLIVGGMAQRSRFCMAGGIRDQMLFTDFHLLSGSAALLVVVIIGNLILGKFHLGFQGQPIAHTDGLWNFLGMALVGWGSVLLGGCPLRQTILAGEGSTDSAITILGMLIGAAICHNFGLASSADGATFNGKIAVGVCALILLAVTLLNSNRKGAKA
ncbi:MAG: YedE-related selenium metabolism membrane protein [Eubacteriales bacterium]|nr:YedE-related selenium metabolism membrane protein [Eubacteriales bacterium]